MYDYATNLRRIMVRENLTVGDVADRTGLDQRTVLSILHATRPKPHTRTLHRLATGLDVPADELFQNPSLWNYRQFDRQTNPLVDELVSERPDLFDGWTECEFEELFSRFGTGGGLTSDGALEVASAMNRKREVMAKVATLLESAEAELLVGLVALLYERVRITKP